MKWIVTPRTHHCPYRSQDGFFIYRIPLAIPPHCQVKRIIPIAREWTGSHTKTPGL